VPGKDLILDPAKIDVARILADIGEIRRWNPQRFEMEQLTAVVFEDYPERVCAGYRDTSEHEFWARGHMPGLPLMPGVIMCEASAQLASYFVQRHDMLGAQMLGLGGLEEVRFRDVVRPGDRLVIVVKLVKVRRGAMISCRFQCFVRENLVCEGMIKGIPLPVEELKRQQQQR
jgi:3-hydroxyacyl-[acyl-carrier-protein] dehydratase